MSIGNVSIMYEPRPHEYCRLHCFCSTSSHWRCVNQVHIGCIACTSSHLQSVVVYKNTCTSNCVQVPVSSSPPALKYRVNNWPTATPRQEPYGQPWLRTPGTATTACGCRELSLPLLFAMLLHFYPHIPLSYLFCSSFPALLSLPSR